MRIPWPTDGGPILFQHGFEYLQARRDDQLLELGLRITEDIDQRQVPWRRGYRLATARDCARLLLHGGSLLGGLHLGFVTGRIARPVKSRRFKFQQLLGHPRLPALWVVAGELAGVAGGWFLMARPFKAATDRLDALTIPDYIDMEFLRAAYAATRKGVGALIQLGGRAVAGMLTIATAGGS